MDALRGRLSDLLVRTRARPSYSSIIKRLVIDNELKLKEKFSVEDRSGIYRHLAKPKRIYSGKSPISANVADSPWFLSYSAQYQKFLLALYGKTTVNQDKMRRRNATKPTRNSSNPIWFNSEQSFAHVNHSELYSAYEALPYPQPIHISASTLNDFLLAFIKHRNFVTGDPVLNKRVKVLSLEYYAAYQRASTVRQQHLKQCNRILRDLRSCSVQILPAELGQFLNYYFFQDRPQVYKEVQKIAKSEGFSLIPTTPLTISRCQDFIDSVGASTSIYNDLLVIAVRSESSEVLEWLKNMIKLGEFVPSRKTVGLLLSQAKDVSEVVMYVDMLQGLPIDTRTVDEVTGAISRVAPDLLEWFFYEFYEASEDMVDKVSPLDGHLHLNFLDEETYNSLMLLYDNLVHHLEMGPDEAPQGHCAPSEHSFYTFLAGSSKVNSRFFDLMWAHGVPLSSRMFKILFNRAEDIKETINLMYALIYEAEKNETGGARLEKLKDQKILSRLRQFLESAEDTTAAIVGTVKFSKDVVEVAYQKLMEFGTYEQRNQCRKLREELASAEAEIYNWSHRRRKGYSLLKEAYLLRKAFLIEVIDVVERGEMYID